MAKVFNSKQTFEEVFKQYFNPLVNYINSHINNWEDSREIVQNTFLKLWEVRERLDIDTSLKSYLYQAAKNGMIDHIRLSKRNLAVKEGIKLSSSEIEADTQGLDSYIIRQELKKALNHLKPKNREIFILHKVEGLTHKEIANHLDISVRAVEDNVKRASVLLKDLLEKNERIFQ